MVLKTDIRKIPIRIKFELYLKAVQLYNEGVNTSEIKKCLLTQFGIDVRINTIYRWVTSRNRPDGLVKPFVTEPSRELSYLIGVLLGDGCTTLGSNYKYIFKLKVKDLDFAEEFSRNISKLLNRDKSYPIRREKDATRGNRTRFAVDVSNRFLYEFLESPVEKLLIYASFYPEYFLRGLFDSDGFTAISAKSSFNVSMGLASAEEPILIFVKNLLEDKFQISSTISKSMSKGESVTIWGKNYTANKDVFSLTLNKTGDVRTFVSRIGFSLERKQGKLEYALSLKDNFNKIDAAEKWKETYVKNGREWVRKEVDSGDSPEPRII